MRRSPREQKIYLLSIPFAVAPIAVALGYSFTHEYDLRYLWMAFASFVGVGVVMVLGGMRRRTSSGLLLLAAFGMLVGAVCAAAVAKMVWSTLSPGLTAVALLFAALWATSHVLDTVSRPRPA
jgi:hypothetical protein